MKSLALEYIPVPPICLVADFKGPVNTSLSTKGSVEDREAIIGKVEESIPNGFHMYSCI
jgi:hypothetical protein